jgi:hypothetical protein
MFHDLSFRAADQQGISGLLAHSMESADPLEIGRSTADGRLSLLSSIFRSNSFVCCGP